MNNNQAGIIKKPWGEEVWFAQTKKYAGKILRVSKGHRLSLQYHERKEETQYLAKGKIIITYGETLENIKKTVLNPGDTFHITPGTIHRMEAIEDSEIFEVSTPELDDVVKIEDDYGRNGSGNDFETDLVLHERHIQH